MKVFDACAVGEERIQICDCGFMRRNGFFEFLYTSLGFTRFALCFLAVFVVAVRFSLQSRFGFFARRRLRLFFGSVCRIERAHTGVEALANRRF